MDASVIVSTSNRVRLLEGALTTLTGQKTQPGLAWRVIVVNNNSRDDTRAVVELAQATIEELSWRSASRTGRHVFRKPLLPFGTLALIIGVILTAR